MMMFTSPINSPGADRTKMRMYALVAALLASSHRLGPAQFEALRTHMKTPASQMVKMLRCAPKMVALVTRVLPALDIHTAVVFLAVCLWLSCGKSSRGMTPAMFSMGSSDVNALN